MSIRHLAAPTVDPALRGVALAFGGLLLLCFVGELARPGFDPSWLWISLAPLPGPVALPLLAGFGLGSIAWAVGALDRRAGPRRILAGLAVMIALFALRDAVVFWGLLASGRIATPAVLPGSLAVAAIAGAFGWRIARARRSAAGGSLRARPLVGAVAAAATALALPLVVVLTYGPTRYERPADCAVVLGAGVRADGTPSLALADRVDEAIRLHRRGLVGAIVMTGGVDPRHGRSEARVMADRAIAAGVPADAIILDEAGVNTRASARNVARLMAEHDLETAIAVTHWYHGPRTALLMRRRGVATVTVPARMTRRLALEPWFVTRELAALWKDLLLGLAPGEEDVTTEARRIRGERHE